MLRSKIDPCSRQFRGAAARGRQTVVARAEHNALLQACQPPSATHSPTAHQTATRKEKEKLASDATSMSKKTTTKFQQASQEHHDKSHGEKRVP